MFSMFMFAAIFASELKMTVTRTVPVAVQWKLENNNNNNYYLKWNLLDNNWLTDRLEAIGKKMIMDAKQGLQGDDSIPSSFPNLSTEKYTDLEEDTDTRRISMNRRKRYTGYISFCHFKICGLGRKGTRYLQSFETG